MAPYEQSMGPTRNAFQQSRVNNGDRMLGGAVLSLALGIWITLVQQGLSGPARQVSRGANAPATQAAAAQGFAPHLAAWGEGR